MLDKQKNLLRLSLTSEVIFSLVRLFLKNSLKRFFGLGPCVWGRGCPRYGTSAQPESHFTCF